jgi:hypothetical protein
MKRHIIVCTLFVGSVFLSAGDTFSEAFEGTVYKAQLRSYSFQRSYNELIEDSNGVFNIPNAYQKTSNAIGGYFGFESAPFYHFSIGATFYTSQPIFYNPKDESGLQLVKDNQQGYSILGEAFVKWEDEKTLLQVGRQRLNNYGFLSDHDIRMTPYTFEAARLKYSGLENVTLRMAAVSGVKTLTSTTYIDFVNASKDLLKEQTIDRNPIRGDYNRAYYDNKGNYIGPQKNLYLASVVYQDKQINFELWNYYVKDFVNIIYAMGSYRFQTGGFSNSVGAEYVKQDDTGVHVARTIDTYAYDLMLKSTYDHFTLQYVFSKVKYDESSLDGGTIIDTWGGGMLYGGLIYNGADQGGSIGNSISLGYYDLILNYMPSWNKKLHFKVELMYIYFDKDYNFRAYEDYHGFNMLHTYDDIMDVRFIVNYTF